MSVELPLSLLLRSSRERSFFCSAGLDGSLLSKVVSFLMIFFAVSMASINFLFFVLEFSSRWSLNLCNFVSLRVELSQPEQTRREYLLWKVAYEVHKVFWTIVLSRYDISDLWLAHQRIIVKMRARTLSRVGSRTRQRSKPKMCRVDPQIWNYEGVVLTDAGHHGNPLILAQTTSPIEYFLFIAGSVY